MASKFPVVVPQAIEQMIYVVRGQKVMLDSDLAKLYGVTTKVFNQAVRRNLNRFPADFMYILRASEIDTLLHDGSEGTNWSQFVTSSQKHRSRIYKYYAFTEQGVAMLSSVLRSPRAVQVNIEIMRAFVRLRQLLASNVELAQKLAALEKKYNKQFKVVFQAIRRLMEEAQPEHDGLREIGFHTIKQATPKGKANRKSI